MANQFYSSAGDGQVIAFGQSSWANCRSGTGGTVAKYDTDTEDWGAYVEKTSGNVRSIYRCFLAFDTSSLPDDATVTAATLKVYPSTVGSSAGGSLCLVAGTQASTSSLATSDYNNVGSTDYMTRVAFSSLSTGSYQALTLNSTGLAAINLSGYTKLALRGSQDVDNSEPTAGTWSGLLIGMSEYTGTSRDPLLEVSYSLSRTTSDAWAWSEAAQKGFARTTTDAWAWSDTARSNHRQTSDSWAWSDTATRPGTPNARTALGSQVTVWATGDSGYTHYAFPNVVRAPNGNLIAIARRSASHLAEDGALVMKSSPDGVTWSPSGQGTVILDYATTGWDERGLEGIRRLASGRIVGTWGRRKQVSGHNNAIAGFMYSDDSGATWSTPTQITDGMFTGSSTQDGFSYGSDILELANGDLLAFGYGTPTAGDYPSGTVWCSKSTNGGASWSVLSTVAGPSSSWNGSGWPCVEPQAALLPNGDVMVTFHTEDGLPTDFYRIRSTDSGATWKNPVRVQTGTTFNRQGLTVFSSGNVLISANNWSDISVRYYESADGGITYGSSVTVAAAPVGTLALRHPLWSMATALTGSGASQNIGFLYGAENDTDSTPAGSQDKASVFWRQFTGTNGAAVYERPATDSWAWSDSAARAAATWSRTTSDSWAWSDVAARTAAYTRLTVAHPTTGANSEYWAWHDTATNTPASYLSRTTSDTWAWSEAATQTAAKARTTSDAWAWSETATRTTASYYSRTTSDTWAWSDSSGANQATIYWLRARRSSSMNPPTKTYSVVQAKGTTRTATWTSPTYKAETEAGILVVLDVTAASGTGGLQLRINAHDLAGSVAVPLNAAPTAVTSTGTTSYVLYPFGAVAGAVTQATSFYLPRQFSITVTHGDSSSYTYSVGYCLLP